MLYTSWPTKRKLKPIEMHNAAHAKTSTKKAQIECNIPYCLLKFLLFFFHSTLFFFAILKTKNDRHFTQKKNFPAHLNTDYSHVYVHDGLGNESVLFCSSLKWNHISFLLIQPESKIGLCKFQCGCAAESAAWPRLVCCVVWNNNRIVLLLVLQ